MAGWHLEGELTLLWRSLGVFTCASTSKSKIHEALQRCTDR